MNPCHHTVLELLPQRKKRLRCRHCHLTLSDEELGEGFCPECFANSGAKRYDFEETQGAENAAARYRCEECGAIISTGP